MNTASKRLEGVGGWLLFLCVGLAVLSPLVSLLNILKLHTLISSAQDRFPAYARTMRVVELLQVVLTIASVYVGRSLWQTRKGAVGAAQTFLLANMAFAFLLAFTPYIGDLPVEIRGKIVEASLPPALVVSVVGTCWYLYLGKSQRVKNTLFAK